MLAIWDEPLFRGGVFIAMFAACALGGVLLYQWGRTRGGGVPRAVQNPAGVGPSNNTDWESLHGCFGVLEIVFNALTWWGRR